MKGILLLVYSLLPKRVSMGLTIGVRLIEGSRSKKAVIIIEKRRSNTYLSRRSEERRVGKEC